MEYMVIPTYRSTNFPRTTILHDKLKAFLFRYEFYRHFLAIFYYKVHIHYNIVISRVFTTTTSEISFMGRRRRRHFIPRDNIIISSHFESNSDHEDEYDDDQQGQQATYYSRHLWIHPKEVQATEAVPHQEEIENDTIIKLVDQEIDQESPLVIVHADQSPARSMHHRNRTTVARVRRIINTMLQLVGFVTVMWLTTMVGLQLAQALQDNPRGMIGLLEHLLGEICFVLGCLNESPTPTLSLGVSRRCTQDLKALPIPAAGH
jgi:hypothetical protein